MLKVISFPSFVLLGTSQKSVQYFQETRSLLLCPPVSDFHSGYSLQYKDNSFKIGNLPNASSNPSVSLAYTKFIRIGQTICVVYMSAFLVYLFNTVRSNLKECQVVLEVKK